MPYEALLLKDSPFVSYMNPSGNTSGSTSGHGDVYPSTDMNNESDQVANTYEELGSKVHDKCKSIMDTRWAEIKEGGTPSAIITLGQLELHVEEYR
ncbi:MAG: hypothetical protein EOP34_05720, partial [Rickettsiales bacterium]